LGGGVVGTNAAKLAVGLGAQVTVLDRSVPRLRQLDDLFGGRTANCFSTDALIRELLPSTDVVIGAVLLPGASAPKLITREHLGLMSPGSVLVDVAIDQGGCFETSKPTTHNDPTYTVESVLHYCVANMPGATPRTSSYALNNVTLPYAMALANEGVEAVNNRPHLKNGLNVQGGKLTHFEVITALGTQVH
jgi:alanine dehydrogenase